MKIEKDNLDNKRHSLAHILAAAVENIYGNVKFGVGPVTENGFYYDFDLKESISEDDLQKIEDEMNKIIKKDYKFERIELSIDEAKDQVNGQPYKEELLNQLVNTGSTSVKPEPNAKPLTEEDKITFYKIGDFVDLCRGGHVGSTGQVAPFKLEKTAGAYWRGDEKNPMLQRVYGVAFQTQDDIDNYFKQQELAKERDHRKLGEELGLFFISPDVGAGLPLLMPRGEMIKSLLMRYMRQKEEYRGYQYVATPVLTQEKLYERSGHASYYLENMYATMPDEEGNKFFIKPMNCPHHHLVFERIATSYRDLPLKLSEHAGLYRYELSGTLTGLIRMRGPITQNDSHTYVTDDQAESEFKKILELFKDVYAETGIENYWFRLSLPNFEKGKYAGNKQQWLWAADVIRECLKAVKVDFVEEEDEAAFYGPKVDVQIKNVAGKEDSIATIQLDIVVPKRMDLTYIDNNGNKKNPLVIHKSIMGAFERFMAFLIEQTNGHFPFWLAPEQVRILTINDKVLDYVEKVKKELGQITLMEPVKYNELRVSVDDRSESLGKKIKDAQKEKIPLMLIIGPNDEKDEVVSARIENQDNKIKLGELEEFITGL